MVVFDSFVAVVCPPLDADGAEGVEFGYDAGHGDVEGGF